MNIFEEATRRKVRFETPKGNLNVEDLWDLKLEALNLLFVNLSERIDKEERKGLIEKPSLTLKYNKLRADIVKYIFIKKQSEKLEKIEEVENKKKKEKILSIISSKQNKELEEKPLEELMKMVEEL